MSTRQAKTILVVDDNPPSRYAVGRVLRHAGFEIVEATTGLEALDMVKTKPDLIVLDINLPDINGFNVCQQIRRNPGAAQIPILMLSATYFDTKSRIIGLSSGADGYLTHPVEAKVLLAYVKALLRTRQAEDAARRAAQQWQSTFEALSNGICVTDPAGRIERANPALSTILDIPLEEILGCTAEEVLGVPISPHRNESSLSEELLWNGRWLHITTNPIPDSAGQVGGLVHIVTDVTERKQFEETLRESEGRFRRAVADAPFPMLIHAENGDIIFVNEAWTSITGYSYEDIPTIAAWTELAYGERKETVRADIDRLYSLEKRLDEGEYVIRTRNGETRTWDFSSSPVGRLPDGRRLVLSMAVDVTERKRTEEVLRLHSERISQLYEAGTKLGETLDLQVICETTYAAIARVMPCDSLAISSYNPEDNLIRYVYVHHNDTPLDVSGFPPIHLEPDDQGTQSAVIRSKEPLYLADYQAYRQAAQTHPSVDDQEPLNNLEGREGENLLRSALIVPLMYESGVVGVIQVLSYKLDAYSTDCMSFLNALAPQVAAAIFNSQLVAELEQRVIERTAQLNRAKEHTEAILNNSKDMMIVCRTDGTIEKVNPALEDAFQCSVEEVLDQQLTSLAQVQNAAELAQTFAAVLETRQSKRLEIGVQYENRAFFDADVVLSPIVTDDHVLGVICSLRDITQRKQMENQLRQILEREMELSELKTRYMSMAAHDLRNPLAVIQSSVSIIHQYGNRLTPEKIEQKYTSIQSSIQIMVDLLDDILTLGRVESGKLSFEPTPLDVNAFCTNLVAEMKQITATSQPINFESHGDCNTAMLDARLLRHIVGNLLSNAIKYSAGKKPVAFAVFCEPDQIIFRIQDQGIGIPEDDQKRLFETFHRASNARHIPGTGLGLAIVKQSVELHGGTISFESEEGRGTTFTVKIPQSPSGISHKGNSAH